LFEMGISHMKHIPQEYITRIERMRSTRVQNQ